MDAHVHAPTPLAVGRVTYRSVLRNPEFRALFVAQALSVVGDQLARLAVALLLYSRSHSATLAAATYAVSYLPWLIGGPLLTTLADRMPRKRLMVLCDVARALLVVAVALPGVPVGLVLVLLAATSLLEPPFNAARSAAVPDIVGDGDEFAVASALGSTTSQLGQVFGFALGGPLVALLSARGAVLFDAATFAVSAIVITVFVRGRPAASSEAGLGLRAWAEGARFVLRRRDVRTVVLLSWLVVAATIAPEAVAVPYAAAHGGGPVTAGLLTAALPAGAVLGLFLLTRVAPRETAERLLLPLAFTAPIVLVATAFDPPALVAGVLWLLAGAASAMQVTAIRLFVAAVPHELRGRAFGFAASGIAVAQGLAALACGWLAQSRGAATAVADIALPVLALLTLHVVRWRPVLSTLRGSVPNLDSVTHDREGDAEMAEPGRRPAARVWALIGILAVLGAATAWHMRSWDAIKDAHIPAWWVLLLFVVASTFPLHVTFRGQRRMVYLDAVPLLIGLFFLDPVTLVTARALAIVVTWAVRRQPLIRLAFNTASFSVATLASVALVRALQMGPARVGSGAWLASVAAVVGYEVVTVVLVIVVVYLYEGRWQVMEAARPLMFSLSTDVVNACLGIITASALAADRATAWVVSFFIVLSLAAFRMYHSLADRHDALNKLYAFAKELGPVAAEPDELVPALFELRRLLRARTLELSLLQADGGDATTITVSGGHERDSVDVASGPLDEAHRVLLRRPTRRAMPTRRRQLRTAQQRRRIAVPVTSQGATVALLRAAQAPDEPREFDASDVYMLEAVADQLAAALEKGKMVETLRRAATRDGLTDLPNLDTLRGFINTMVETGSGGVVILLDLDRFHDINDTLGHDAGDAVLIEVAGRLEDAASHGSLPARIGADQFALAIPGAAGSEVARLAALAVKSRVEGPLRLASVSADIRVTLGTARAPDHGRDATTLLRRAEMAMAAAKGTTAGINEWEPSYERDGTRRLHLLTGLRSAIAAGELTLAFQPKLRLGSGEVTGFEALVRWHSRELGPVSPAEFVPLAEASGLIGALTTGVLREALDNCRSWHAAGKPVGVSVNISARSLDDPVLVGQVAALLTATHIAPHWLTLEITESSVMENPQRSLEVLRQLRSLGVRLSVDDFGTGYSSLHYLRGLPVHEIKIDKSFVDHVGSEGADRAVVRAVVEMCESLGLTTVAEGVEQAAQAYALESLGVHEVQGFFYGRPMTAVDATSWLESRSVAPALDELL
jgi:diguanylate cyclase (GGDEF)-like protein